MDEEALWRLFVETGLPEVYALLSALREQHRQEEQTERTA